MKKFTAGEKVGRLTIVGFAGVAKGRARWLVACSCGGPVKSVDGGDLRRGQIRSCGCLKRESLRLGPESIATHRMAGSPTYQSWASMKQRCLNPRNKRAKDYADRGIEIDPRWLNFENFLSDMGVRPDGKSLDRRDNELGYGPQNCRWASAVDQQNNTRLNRIVEWSGVRLTIAEWARARGLSYSRVHTRLRRGWPPGEALGFEPRSEKANRAA